MTPGQGEGRLLKRWRGLMEAFGLDEAAARPVFAALQDKYEEDGRYYHNTDHVRQVLDTVDGLAPYAEEVPPVKVAAWFHDAVYEPGAADNEARSAHYLRQQLQPLSIPAAVLEEASRLILLTKEHEAETGDGNGRVLLDADLAILGTAPGVYDRYARAIRHEFAHVPEEAYRRGRAGILRRFLQRESLYHTPPMRQEREAAARRNIRRELAALGDG